MRCTLLICLLCSMTAKAACASVPSSALADRALAARSNRAACGPLAVSYVLERLGHPADSEELIKSAELNQYGTSIRRLLGLLADRNCPGRPIHTDKGRLTLLPLPAILIVDQGTHCIVYDGLDESRQMARIFETTTREVRLVSLAHLQTTWTGEAIIFADPRPSPYAFFALCFFVMSILVAPAACLLYWRGHAKPKGRGGFTLIELLVAIGVVAVLGAFLLPAIHEARESSRTRHCAGNLRQIGLGLQNYELHFRTLPPAVVWKPAGEPLGQGIAPPGSIDRISLGISTPQDPDRVHANWAIALLPFLGEESLYNSFDHAAPVGAPVNAGACATDLAIMKCPTDIANGPENHFQRAGLVAADAGYARGNYAINGGTNRRCLTRLSSRRLECKDGFLVDGTDLQRDTTQVWGSGVAGVNRAMALKEFTCGLSRLVVIEEIRAGVNPLDRRGVWALGFAGSSVAVCHGLYGNKGPNRGKDAIQGCSAAAAQGIDPASQGMPCLQSKSDTRFEVSERATARSMHVAGVNLLMADGSVHFVLDAIDARTWHNMHRRDHQGALEF